jgi:pentapeptide repeat protein
VAVFKRRVRPESWALHRARAAYGWMVPLFALEWIWLWVAYLLSGWAFLEVLEYLGTLSVLLGVISYIAESNDRVKQRHYQAWQVINSAQSKGGSGGRIDALEGLHKDHVPLIGVDVSGAFLQGIALPDADLTRAHFSDCDVRGGNFQGSKLDYADLGSGNFRGANFSKARLNDCYLQDADLTGADFSEGSFEGANLSRADLRLTDWRDAKWRNIANVQLANLFGIKNAPPGFIDWANHHGAVSIESDNDWQLLLNQE